MHFGLISANLPPVLDGIGDHSALLMRALACHSDVDVTIWNGDSRPADPIPGVAIHHVFEAMQPSTVDRLAAAIAAAKPDWVMLQYNPFSYGKWGLNLQLPMALRRLRRTLPGTRFALMMHEPFVPIINAKFAVMTTWQRTQLALLGRASDVVLVSIEQWAEQFRSWFPGRPVIHLPCGSTMPRVEADKAAERQRLGIGPEQLLVGLFGQAHPTRMLPETVAAVRSLRESGRDALLMYVGPAVDHLRSLAGDLPLRTEGPLPAPDVSRCLTAMDLYMAPFSDGATTRRSSLLVALEHGLPILSTHGPLTDSFLVEQNGKSIVLADVNQPDSLSTALRKMAGDPSGCAELGRNAAAVFEAHFSWTHKSEQLLRILAQIPPRKSR